MSNYLIGTKYNFSVDLDINEDQLPFIKPQILIESPYPISFKGKSKVEWYFDSWSLYGDGELIALTNANLNEGTYCYSNRLWRYKYNDFFDSNHCYHLWCSKEDYDYLEHNRIIFSSYDQIYANYMPCFGTDYSLSKTLPYNQIKVCRNKYVSIGQAHNINPSADQPDLTYISFDNLEKAYKEYNIVEKPKQDIVWQKIVENSKIKGIKYRLNISGYLNFLVPLTKLGEFKYWEYEDIYTAKYVTYYPEGGDPYQNAFYELSSQNHQTKVISIHDSISFNPKIKLLINYINKNNKIETKIVEQ